MVMSHDDDVDADDGDDVDDEYHDDETFFSLKLFFCIWAQAETYVGWPTLGPEIGN